MQLIRKNIINEPKINVLNNFKSKLKNLNKGDIINIYLYKANKFIQSCSIVKNDIDNEELEIIETKEMNPRKIIQYFEIVKFDYIKKIKCVN